MAETVAVVFFVNVPASPNAHLDPPTLCSVVNFAADELRIYNWVAAVRTTCWHALALIDSALCHNVRISLFLILQTRKLMLLADDFVAFAILAHPTATFVAIDDNYGIFGAHNCDTLLLLLLLSHGVSSSAHQSGWE